MPKLWERVEAKALKEYSGNRSSYIRELVEDDLNGATVTPFTPKQIDQWIDDEVSLIEAGRIALKALRADTPKEEREKLLNELAESLVNAAFRRPSGPDLKVAEEQSSYGVPTSELRSNPQQPNLQKKKRA